MINERMTFYLKYGFESEALKMWKGMNEAINENSAGPRDINVIVNTCLSGRTNTISQDILLKSLNDHNPVMYYWKINPKVQEAYARFVTTCDSSKREIFNIEYEKGIIKNLQGMVAQRNTFQLHYGKAKDSIAIWKEMIDEGINMGLQYLRLMTDVVGQNYILEAECYFPDMCEIKPRSEFWLQTEKMKLLYEKFIPLCKHAERSYLAVEADLRRS
jgi:hypothetical protein